MCPYQGNRASKEDWIDARTETTTHHELQRGTPLEIRWLSDGVVHLGNAVGVATPLSLAIADVLALREAGAPAAYETRSMESYGAT